MSDNLVEILLVEDNPNDLKLTLRALEKPRIANHIEVARDGAVALDFIFGTGHYEGRDIENHPRLILLDLKLPKVDGLEVLQRVKMEPKLKRVPVVILSSSHEERDIVASYDLGVNSYVVKPVDYGEFAETVQRVGIYWLTLNQAPTQ